MERITSVKFKVAIGCAGGGCLVEVVEPTDNHHVSADVNEYGGDLEDFFHKGTEPPKEAGLYLFEGVALGAFCGSDVTYRYEGTFSRIKA